MEQTLSTGIMDVDDRIAAELDRRLDEDDSTPDDAVAWKTIKAEAQARWQH